MADEAIRSLNLKLGRRAKSSGLDRIPRSIGRARFGNGPLPFQGEDLWNAYEVSFLLPGGKPMVAHMRARYDAHSPYMVESKSFKLFLNALNDRVFEGIESFSDTVKQALEVCVDAPVSLAFFLPDRSPGPKPLPGSSLDGSFPHRLSASYQPELLQFETASSAQTFVYHSHLLRSNCPVTHQPDWGSVLIRGKARRVPVPETLLAYLISFRQTGDFHEACCETMFMDLHRLLEPTELEIGCFYTRRGGLDINPRRATHAELPEAAPPVWRQ